MITLLIILLVILTLGSSFFSLSQIAFFSLSTAQIKLFAQSSNHQKNLVAKLVRNPQALLVTLLMCDISINILIQNTVANIFEETNQWVLKVGIPLVITLLFGELIPKVIAFPYNETISWRIAPLVHFFHWILAPVLKVLTYCTNVVYRIMFGFLRKSPDLTRKELDLIVSHSAKTKILSEDEVNLLRGYLSLSDTTVKNRMVPRHELFTYDVNQDLKQLVKLFAHKDLSRIPVIDGDLDHLLGIIDAQTYFIHSDKITTSQDLISLLKPPLYVPETITAKAVLKKLFQNQRFLAVVLDEYGSVNGVISREDLYEVVTGEIVDRHEEKTPYTQVNDSSIIASGKLEIQDFEQLFHLKLPNEKKCSTLGGWLTEMMGDIPKAGAKFSTEKFFFHVLAADPNRIRRVFIKKINNVKKR